MNDVFISYTQPDRNEACRIHDMFLANHLVSWVAPSQHTGIRTGIAYESQIVQAIKNSKVFVLVYSKHCNKSDDIIQEIRHRNKNHATIIFRLDDSAFRDDLSYHLRGIQYIDAIRNNLYDAINRLLLDVRKCINAYKCVEGGSTDQLLFLNGIQLIGERKYGEAAAIFLQHLQILPDSNETRFYLCLAMISGRQTKKIDGVVVRKMEATLLPATTLRNEKGAGCINVLLAVIKYGYYVCNGLRVPEPPIEQLITGVKLASKETNALSTHLSDRDHQWLKNIS